MIKKLAVGDIIESKNYGLFEIISINNCNNVVIKFKATGCEVKSRLADVKRGNVKDYMLPSVYGVGIIGNKYPSRVNGKMVHEYSTWMNMLKRCYHNITKINLPTYQNCVVSDNFKYYPYFYEWCNEQVGFGDGFHLDKDLLIKDNKIYSENTCVFLPQEINKVLTKANSIRGKYPIGVYFNKKANKFMSQICINNQRQKYLGLFDDEVSAFNAYKQTKEDYIKELAEKWKYQIDKRAYNALIRYEVSITD